jgi:UDP-N-acetylmuramoylalanine--D-glutamate ligase
MLPRTALVLGLGRSGVAAAAALERRGLEVTRVDREPPSGAVAEDDASLDGVELVVKSPGVPGEKPLVAEARRRGIPVWSEIELGYRLLGSPILAVTGTNGKTTTVGLLGAMFAAAEREVALAGNEQARQLSDLDELPRETWIVCEISSFQLEDIDEFRPRVAVLVNLEPDHLDRHGTLEAYRDAKLRIFENQTAQDVAVVPRSWDLVPGLGRRVGFAASDPLPAEPLIPGAHNRENAAAATAAARAAGLPDDAIAEALRTFPGVPHRLELVAEVDGVRYVNDSKATNVAAARRGLAAYADEPLRLILGGSLKGESFRPLAEAVGPNVRSVHLIGEASGELAAELERAGVFLQRDGDLARAVRAAAAVAEPGEVVLLSPACASYDQFTNFEERGDAFRELVAGISGT